jgi:hypothetical protein
MASPRIPDPRFRRPYLAAAGMAASGLALALAGQHALARALFGSEPVPADRVIALAQPLAGNRWTLVLLEQLQETTPCWQRQDAGGPVNVTDSATNPGLCGRYSSSSAYSLRVNGTDLTSSWRLRLETDGGQLQLQATSPQAAAPLVVASAPIPESAPAASQLVPLEFQPGWGLEQRSYEGRRLSHLYLSNADPLPLLLAKASSSGSLLARPALPPPPVATQPRRTGPAERIGYSERIGDSGIGGVIALQVVPYRD